MNDDLGQLDQYLLLAIMRLQPRAYGVSILDHIKEKTGKNYSVGAVYAALDRLQGRGYVRDKQGESTPERGGRRKTYFELTAPGQVALQQSLNSLQAMRRGVRWAEATT